jgi:hypothetical protein
MFAVSPFAAGWLLVAEFIFTLAMALKCYPLLPGGLLAFEAVAIGMTTADHVKEELSANLEVLLLLMFMVAGKEAALFLPTGTQANLVALLSHCERGEEYIVGQGAHNYLYEAGGATRAGDRHAGCLQQHLDGARPARAFARPDIDVTAVFLAQHVLQCSQ